MHALQPARSDVAVILNANAKKVTPRLRAKLEQSAKGVDLYYSRSLEEGQVIARQILAQGYPTVLTGGGDGTFIQMVNFLYQQTNRIESSRDGRKGEVVNLDRARRLHGTGRSKLYPPDWMPNVGILRLGTGNAVANVVHAGNCVKDVRQVHNHYENGMGVATRQIGLMESERQVFPFAGLGWDGAVLNDYVEMKEQVKGHFIEPLVKSAFGYVLAAALKTAPVLLRSPRPQVVIEALDEGYAIDSKGRRIKRFEKGDVLYKGPSSLITFGTVPYIGAKLKLFPFAQGVDSFQLRVANMSSIEGFMHLPWAWFGKMNTPKVADFVVKNIRISCDRPMPYQMGGDAMGERQYLEVGMSASPLSTVDFRASRDRGGMLPGPV